MSLVCVPFPLSFHCFVSCLFPCCSYHLFPLSPARRLPLQTDFDVTPISRFEKTNHAVLLVGYGEEAQKDGSVVKYWKCKNSWSRRWGEARDPTHELDAHGHKDGGYFRIVRGTDCLAIESMPVVIEP